MITEYFKRVPPKIAISLFYFYVITGAVSRYLFRSVYGLLVLVVFLYLSVEAFTGVSPLSFEQLILAVSGLDLEYKVALFTSVVTIAGFSIAFHTATINWRRQMQAQFNLQVASEFEVFFADVSRNMTSSKHYAENLIDCVTTIRRGASQEEAEFLLRLSASRESKFIESRSVLSDASIEVLRLLSKNAGVLNNHLGAYEAVQRAADELSDVADSIWIHVPVLSLKQSNPIGFFVEQVDIDECYELAQRCERALGIISGVSGAIQGQLQSTVLDFGVPALVKLISQRESFKRMAEEFHHKLNDKVE